MKATLALSLSKRRVPEVSDWVLALGSAASLSRGRMPPGHKSKRRMLFVYEVSDWVLIAFTLSLLSFPLASFADAVLYISPEKGTYTAGQVFEVKVYADTGGKLINAAEGDISFNTEALAVDTVSEDGSILQSWSTPPQFSNDEGTIRFAGWTKNNYSGVGGLLITVRFKALRTMVGNARLAAGAILAADGQESNIITSMRSGVFKIAAPDLPEDVASINHASSSKETSSSTAIDAKLPAPVFDDAPDQVAIGDHIVVRGNTEPNAHVTVYLAHGSESEKETQILSASDGSFTYVSDDPTVAGVYHMRASVIANDGRQSVPTDAIDITVSPTGVAASAIFGASLIFETIPFFALLILGGLGAAYIYHRHQLAKMQYGRDGFFDQQ